MTDDLTRPIGVHQLDATGVPTGYAPLSDGSGQYVPGAVSVAGGGDFTRVAIPKRLVPYGVKMRGVNIVSINLTGGATGDPWGELFSDAANFATIIKPQVDLANQVGANTIRCIGGIAWVVAGTVAVADHVANYERFVDYCADLGIMVYACLSDAGHFNGATKAQAIAVFEPLVTMLNDKWNVVAVDVIQEIGLHFSTISGGQTLHDYMSDVLTDLRTIAPNLPMTCSNTHASNSTTAQWSSTTVAAVDAVVDFHDFHPYYDGMVASDLTPLFGNTTKPVVLGEYGGGTSEPTRTNRITAAAAVSILAQVVGSFCWAITDYNATDPTQAWGLYDSTFTARTAPITAFETVPDREGHRPYAGHIVEDEGVVLPQRARLNFVGAGVTATDDATDDRTVVTIPGATGLTIQDENSTIATGVTQIDFQGVGVTATAGSGEVVVTIPGASSSTGELLMQDGVTAPPVPIETEARDDWLYAG